MGKKTSVLHHPVLFSRLALERTPVGIVLLDAEDRVLWANEGFRRLLCREGEDPLGRPLGAIVLGLPAPLASASEPPDAGHGAWQTVAVAAAGEVRMPLELWMADRRLAQSPEGVARVLTFVEAVDETPASLAGDLHDPLTGLASVELFEDRLRHAGVRAERLEQGVAVLLARLDRRDELGERLGEEVVGRLEQRVGRRLSRTLRREDSITRLGSGLWGVLIEYPVTPDGLQTTALRCQEAMEPPFNVEGRPILLTLSIGIALYPGDAEVPEQLLHSAELALARTRQAGHAFFERGLRQALADRLAFRRSLQEALLAPDRHFQLVYQPQIDLRDGRCLGLEALIRWHHPRHGILMPGEFLPVAVEMGLIVRLDRWVIERVVIEHGDWQARGSRLAGLGVAVNTDAGLLEQSVFDRRPLDVFLRQQSERLDWLSLELEAQGFIDRSQAQAHLLRRVMALGVGLVVNDIGRGPIDLARLASLPVSRVKLSRGLVGDLEPARPERRRTIEALTRCLDALRLESVMVGIETPAQLEAARALGVGTVQGNLLCEPLAPSQLEAWLDAQAASS